MHKKIDVFVYETLQLNLIYFMYTKCDGCISFLIIREITPRPLGEISSELLGPKGKVAQWAVNLGFLKQVRWTDAFIKKNQNPNNNTTPKKSQHTSCCRTHSEQVESGCELRQEPVPCQPSEWQRAQGVVAQLGKGPQSQHGSWAGRSQATEL